MIRNRRTIALAGGGLLVMVCTAAAILSLRHAWKSCALDEARECTWTARIRTPEGDERVIQLDLRKDNETLAELLVTEIEKLQPKASESPANPVMVCSLAFEIVRNVDDPSVLAAARKLAEQERARLGPDARSKVSYTETWSAEKQLWVVPGPIYYLTSAGDAFDPADSTTWDAECPWRWKDAAGYLASRMVKEIRRIDDWAHAPRAVSASP